MNNRFNPIRFYRIRFASCVACAFVVASLGCQPNPKNSSESKQIKTTRQVKASKVSADATENFSANATHDENATPVRVKVTPHPKTSNFTDLQLNKDHTLCVMAFDSITRQSYFLSHYRHLMTEEQIEKSCLLIDSFDSDFADLARQRELILNTATANTDVATLLKNNDIEVILTSRLVRRKIMHEIYTRKQRQQYNEEYEANRRKKNALKEPNPSN